MGEKNRIILQEGSGEIIEKKSRFIATVFPVSSEQEALLHIEEKRKKYWDASHNCYAFLLDAASVLQRFSDDGEPGGTAGKPMLDVLSGNHLVNAAAVVTRYFGGTLLGTGGLVRAYAEAVKAAVSSAIIITRISGVKLEISTDYTGLGKIQYILGENQIKITDCIYTESVTIHTVVPEDFCEKIIYDIRQVTSGQAVIRKEKPCFYGEHEGDVLFL